MAKTRTEPTAIDLFAGAGGFSLAAHNVGINVLAAVELNEHASSTYRRNLIDTRKSNAKLYTEDILDLSPETILKEVQLSPGQCDFILGGPPCQGFSVHRFKDQGVNDPRNALLLRYFHFVSAIRPKIFLIENVPGLLWPRHQSYVSRFYALAAQAGYSVSPPVMLNARDFGVPQNRRRVFIIGVHGKHEEWLRHWPPQATHEDPLQHHPHSPLKPWDPASTVFKRTVVDDPNNVHMRHSAELVKVFQSTPKNGGSRHQSNRQLPCHLDHNGHKDVYGRINPKVCGPTMTTACINPSKGRFVHPTQNHGITVRQAARFQDFPDWYVFNGGIIAAGVQVGNAVPIKLGEVVLTAGKNILQDISHLSQGRTADLSRAA
jgi:DNA (cytosine-5)-methyltransferase 1